jgi:CTP synthase (UTP-ammonia lyase)
MLLRIGVLGDFDPKLRNHEATQSALHHAGGAMLQALSVHWVPTESVPGSRWREVLGQYDAILAAPGSPYRSMEGMLAGIAFARANRIPFLGTCGGFQYALIEYARNVLGLAGADTEENEDGPAHAIITPVACPIADRRPGASRLSGVRRVSIRESTRMSRIYVVLAAEEEYFCNFEVNPEYVSDFEKSGLVFSAYGEQGEVRALELPSHPFYVATLFQPQLRSREGEPHPVITAFLQAALGCRMQIASGLHGQQGHAAGD